MLWIWLWGSGCGHQLILAPSGFQNSREKLSFQIWQGTACAFLGDNISASGESRALSVHEQNQSLLIPTPGFPELISSHLSEWRLRS